METVLAKSSQTKNQARAPKNKTTHTHTNSYHYFNPKFHNNNGSQLFHNPFPHQRHYYQPNPPLLPLPTNVPIPRNYSLPCRTRNLAPTFPPRKQPKPVCSKPFGEPQKETKPNSEEKCRLVPLSSFDVDGALFGLESPPPASLPLPRFSRRSTPSPKLSCNAEAVGNADSDNDATYNLRKMLRLT